MSSEDPNREGTEHQDMEPEEFDHQGLYKEPNERRKKPTNYTEGYELDKKRDRLEFAQEKIEELEGIEGDFAKRQAELKQDFDSKLIFEIKTFEDKYKGDRFSEDLAEVGVEIISASGSEKGQWLGYSKTKELSKLKESIIDYGNITKIDKTKDKSEDFRDFIKNVKPITAEKKQKPSLTLEKLKDEDVKYFDVELRKIESEANEIDSNVDKFKQFAKNHNAEVTDTYVSSNLCILKVKANKTAIEKILLQGQVKSVNRSHKPSPDFAESRDTEELAPKIDIIPPDENATSVLVVDSGVVEHPLLKDSLNSVTSEPTHDPKKIRKDRRYDDVGHGTRMAGIVLYGDLKKCKETSTYVPEIRINSSKVMYPCEDDHETPCFDTDELLEHQLANAVKNIVEKDPNCRIINLSIGDESSSAYEITEQLPIAMLIDELSWDYSELIFVVSAGNFMGPYLTNYPNYLLNNDKESKIIDPGTSAHALTIGAVRNYSEKPENTGYTYPSSFTRVGLGFKDMIKPELVDFGGDKDHDIICIERSFLKEKGWFTADYGSSTSAALISHYLAKLCNANSEASRNMIKALLLSSAEIPKEKPKPIPRIFRSKNKDDLIKNLQIYGYGRPNLQHALYSGKNRVILKNESEIELGKIIYYSLYLPEEFYTLQGIKEITVTLVYDPPVDQNKSSYLGLTLDYKLYKNVPTKEVQRLNSLAEEEDVKANAGEIKELSKNQFTLTPGFNFRSNSTHQKSSFITNRKIDLNFDEPLTLAVKCNKRWFDQTDYVQPYAVIVKVKHSGKIDLYNKVLNINRIKHPVRVRVGETE